MYVYSTLSASLSFEIGEKGDRVIIAGGANVTTKHMWTPRGVATEITKEQLEALRENRSFSNREKNGYFSVSQFEKNADKVAGDMAGADGSAQKDLQKVESESKAKSRK